MKFNKNHISKIKLIIWDLDETFWKGTLSDININAHLLFLLILT